MVCLGHNLCCWAQHLGTLGGGRHDGELRAKRLRYRYRCVPAMLVRGGRRRTLRFPAGHPFLKRLVAARPAPKAGADAALTSFTVSERGPLGSARPIAADDLPVTGARGSILRDASGRLFDAFEPSNSLDTQVRPAYRWF